MSIDRQIVWVRGMGARMSGDNRFLQTILGHLHGPATRPFCTLIRHRHEETMDWGELAALSYRFAALYRRQGIGPRDTVLVFLGHGKQLYAAFVGAMLIGAVPSMMPLLSSRQDATLFWQSHAALLRRLEPAFIVATSDTIAEMRAGGLALAEGHVVATEDLPAVGEPQSFMAAGGDVAVLQHSSGTTGLKKGVALTYAGIVDQLESYARALRLSEGDSIASWLPLYHDMGFVACFLLPLYFGLPIRHIDPFYWTSRPATLLAEMNGRSGVLAWMPNFGFEHIARTVRDAARYDLSGVKAWINCSEPCKPQTFDRFVSALGAAGVRAEQLQCCYAMAENTFAATQTPPGLLPRRVRVEPNRLGIGQAPICPDGTVELIDVGPDIDGVETILVDSARRKVADGIVGEVALRGTSLFAGYNLDPEKTAQRLVDGTYYSGDLGLRHEGRLYVLGRQDDLIIVNGRNLFAHEIEAACNRIVGIKPGRLVAVGRPNEQTGSNDLLIIAERDAAVPADDDAVRRDIMSVVNSIFGVNPKEVALREAGWLIKTTSGKISRHANLARHVTAQA